MDIFDRYLYDEITETYTKDNLFCEDYEELYQRSTDLSHVSEAMPYLMIIRYLGLVTPEEPVLITALLGKM